MRQGRLEAFLGRPRPDKAGGGSSGARNAPAHDAAADRKRTAPDGEAAAAGAGSKENRAPAAAGGKAQGLSGSGAAAAGAGAAAAGAGVAAPAPTTAPVAAAPKAPAALGAKPAAPSGGGKLLAKRSMQMFLDLGQRDFNASRCPACGMVYARGQAEDEKLHRSYCGGGGSGGCSGGGGGGGIKFPGWASERVLLSEAFQGAQGRLLLVAPSDPAGHVKKVQEVAALVERLHCLTPGWLLAGEQWRAFLYVTTARRVVGLLVAEPLRQAFRVVAPGSASGGGGGGGEEAESAPRGAGASGSGMGVQQAASGSGSGAAGAAAAAAPERKGVWRGLHGRAASHAAQGLSGGGGSSLGSGGGGGRGADGGAGEPAAGAGAMSPPRPRGAAGGGGSGTAAAGGAAAAAGGSGRMLGIDRSRPARAAVGVRMVWVSPEARRRGVASRLLDAARANMVACYVAPRAQLAFTQPTEAGAALAAAYVGSQEWLIYGV